MMVQNLIWYWFQLKQPYTNITFYFIYFAITGRRWKKRGEPSNVHRWRNSTPRSMKLSFGVTAAKWRCRNMWLTAESLCFTEDCWSTWARKTSHTPNSLMDDYSKLKCVLLFCFSQEHRKNTNAFWWKNKADHKHKEKFIITEQETDRYNTQILTLSYSFLFFFFLLSLKNFFLQIQGRSCQSSRTIWRERGHTY